MDICIYNLKINDILASFNKQLLPIYQERDIAALNTTFEKAGAVSVLNVDCLPMNLAIELDMSKEDSHETDDANIRLLYGGLMALPPNIAARPDFWAWYIHAYQSNYAVYRSETTRENYTEQTVMRDFFCRSGKEQPRRMMVVNLLSRLWWTGKLLYDEQHEDPYHFLSLFTKSAFNSKVMLLASSTAPNNPEIMMGLLDAVETFRDEHGLDDVSRTHIIQFGTKYLNSIGAVKMIDTLGRKKIKDICLARLEDELGD